MAQNAALTMLVIFLGLAPTNADSFDEVMQLPLHRCSVVLYSHELKEEEGERFLESDHNLVEEAMKLLVKIQVPLQFWVLRRSAPNVDDTVVFDGLYRNRKITCITFLWFLKPWVSSKTQTMQVLPWVQFSNRMQYTEYDYTIIGFENTLGSPINVDLTYRVQNIKSPDAFRMPGNMIFVRMRPDTKTDLEENKFHVESVGGLRYYCSASLYFCVDWYKVKGNEGIWTNSAEFHIHLAPLSAHSNGGVYNFHKARINVKKTASLGLPQYWNAIRALGYRKGLLPPNDPESNKISYGVGASANIRLSWTNVEILENIFNGTLHVIDVPSKKLETRWPLVILGLNDANPLGLGARAVANEFGKRGFYCVDSKLTYAQFYALFYPMDKWTWGFLLCAGGALTLTFYKYTKNPLFNLITLFFAQGDGEQVRKFKLLLVLWSCLGLLLTAGYSSLIASLLIVPSGSEHPRDFKEIYEQGYRLIVPNVTFDMRGLTSSIRKDVLQDAAFKAKNIHLIKLEEETIDHDGDDMEDGIPDYIVRHGKLCQSLSFGFDFKAYCQLYLEAYEDIICFVNKEHFIITLYMYFFALSNAEVLRRGVQDLYAVGIINLIENYRSIVQRMDMISNLTPALSRTPGFRAGYFFRITGEKEPFLFTIRNSQGQMVFYFGLICAGVSLGGLLLEMIAVKRKEFCGSVRRNLSRFNIRKLIG